MILLLVAGGLFVKAQLGYREATASYDKLEQYAVADDSGDGVPTVDFDALKAINPDIVAWIYVPGTVINYPVTQTTDNSTYLTKLFDGTYNNSGSIFMDMDDAAPGAVDQQTTLYGHHMTDGSMFNIIDKTADQATFDTVKSVYYITPDATYEFKPMFTAKIKADDLEARTPNFTKDPSFSEYLQQMLDASPAQAKDAKKDIASAEKVLTLVTCAGDLPVPTPDRSAMVCTLVNTVSADGGDKAAATDGAATADAGAADAATAQ